MAVNTIVLFGKHPAWSDHMFVSDDTTASHYLKRVFYDHSVIPALQGGDGEKRISETWSFLVFIEGQAFFIINAVSRDSVGRRRFPLIAAYPLPKKIKLEAALEELRQLKNELRSLLSEMLEPASENLNQWQETVIQKAKSFQSKVDWSSIDSSEASGLLKRDEVLGLMNRLANDYDALDLKFCSFAEACNFILLGLKQFKSPPPAMLALDEEERGQGLFFATEAGTSFHLKRFLYNNLTSFVVPPGNISPKISRLLKSAEVGDKELLSIDEVPSLKLGIHEGSHNQKFIILAISCVFVVLVLFGFLFSCSSESDSCSEDSSEADSTQQTSVREKWHLNAVAYIEWIQPLVAFIDKQTEAIPEFEQVAAALETDLNPFTVVGAEKISLRLAKHPLDEFLSSENIAKLNTVYANIRELESSLTAYYEKQFSDELIKNLKRQNYPQPKFIEVDFSQQPLTPDFGPGLVSQFDSYVSNRRMLSDLVVTTKSLWDSIIKPLHETCPEHAKYIQRYVQNLIEGSGNIELFQEQYEALLKLFGYPEFIQIDAVNLAELSKTEDWYILLEGEQSVESLQKLVELLEINQKDKLQDQPPQPLQTPQPLQPPQPSASNEPVVEKPAASDNVATVEAAENLVLYIENLISKGQIEETHLTTIKMRFNALDSVDHTSELNDLVRVAFEKRVQELRASDPVGLLKLYKNMAVYLPQSLQTQEDKGLEQVALYWSSHDAKSGSATPTKEELENLRSSADLPVVEQFYTGLLNEYDKINSQSTDTALSKIENSRGVESVSIDDDQSQLEVVFEGDLVKLIFLPLETDNGTVFVQQNALGLQQYIELSGICDFDTEYYLTLQDRFWPRSFEVGMGTQFSTLGEWQFRDRGVFSPINAFNRKTLPAHLNEPVTVLRMAKRFGFRLLEPKECAAFIRLMDGSPVNSLKFPAVDKENLENSKTIQSSVYAESIVELLEQDAWFGGIDFERGTPGADQFFDVLGGSAELAYDGTDFYVLGGSWLYKPSVLEKPVRIAEPSRMYIDLGIRFAVDVPDFPTQSYGELVQELALQLVTGSE